MPIDLRSDTVTRPTPGMRAAMAAAEVGDDTFREDPTLLKLEARMAELTGKEAALFVPSGHMGNQVCLRSHSQPGDALICHRGAHILAFESGAPCALSGLLPLVIDSVDGTFTREQARAMLAPDNIHHANNRIVAMENTHNRCGGTVWPLAQLRDVCRFAHEHGLAAHVDGARLWNACAATGTQPSDWLADADSVSMCFSKGLGAPVGSCIAGSKDFIARARFIRKMFGGQMRQAGVLAAAALYALDNHWSRMAEDHDNARLLAGMLEQIPGVHVIPPQSNIVIFELTGSGGGSPPSTTPAGLVQAVAEQDVHVFAISDTRIRAVCHLDVTTEQVLAAGTAFQQAMQRLASTAAVA